MKTKKKKTKGKKLPSEIVVKPLRLALLITLLVIFAVEITYSLFIYMSVIKRPVLVRGLDRKEINPNNFSIFGNYLFMTNLDGRFLRQVDKLTGNTEWEYYGTNIVDAVMDSKRRIYVFSQKPSMLTVFSDKKKIKEIMLLRDIEASNMAIDKSDSFYIADKKTNKIFKYDNDGNPAGEINAASYMPPNSIGKISIDSNNRMFAVIKPGIVKEFDLSTNECIKQIKIPYLTKGSEAYSLISVKRTMEGDIYINDHMGSRMLVFNKKWRIKGVFYQESTRKLRFIACGPIDIDENSVYINNYIIFVFNFI